jgi:hypothetical protein
MMEKTKIVELLAMIQGWNISSLHTDRVLMAGIILELAEIKEILKVKQNEKQNGA